MNVITRETAADYFQTGRYEFTGEGCPTWSAWDSAGREWKFQEDISIHGDDSKKCEFVAPILRYEDIEELLGVLRALKNAGAQIGRAIKISENKTREYCNTVNPAFLSRLNAQKSRTMS